MDQVVFTSSTVVTDISAVLIIYYGHLKYALQLQISPITNTYYVLRMYMGTTDGALNTMEEGAKAKTANNTELTRSPYSSFLLFPCSPISRL